MAMGKIQCAAVLASVLALAGCETYSDVAFTGHSNAAQGLRQDTLKLIDFVASTRGCTSIEQVDSAIEHYEPVTGENGHNWGRENWMVTGCSRPYPVSVSYDEDGRGGTILSVVIADMPRVVTHSQSGPQQ